MRYLSYPVVAILLFTFFFSSTIFAQDESPHFFTVSTFEFIFPDDGSMAEWDSLNTLIMENVINQNEYIVSQRVLRHRWGNNSLDIVYVSEYNSFADIEKGQDRRTELFNETWATEEEREAFNDALFRHFGN